MIDHIDCFSFHKPFDCLVELAGSVTLTVPRTDGVCRKVGDQVFDVTHDLGTSGGVEVTYRNRLGYGGGTEVTSRHTVLLSHLYTDGCYLSEYVHCLWVWISPFVPGGFGFCQVVTDSRQSRGQGEAIRDVGIIQLLFVRDEVEFGFDCLEYFFGSHSNSFDSGFPYMSSDIKSVI